mmetsp:Transcript_22220/g.32452  ORF Transcript_22220/g.32452 Transcript_22220/m.32452 type:complete len:391 (+) Transcript_22220:103-1275(+)
MKNRSIISIIFLVQAVALLLLLPQSTNAFVSPNAKASNAHALTNLQKLNQGTLFIASADTTGTGTGGTCLTTHSSLTHDAPTLSDRSSTELNPLKAALTKAGMVTFVLSMCVALPLTLIPPAILHKAKLISKTKKERASLRTGQFCSRWLMRLIPFAKVQVVQDDNDSQPESEPTIWVCNHTSMLDIFILLATDKKLRGKNKRPIKIIYWKDLEKNPVTGLLFKMSGFLPVEMEDNGSGSANQYKRSSFKKLLRGIKEAFDEGFDIGILPEGQLNPRPEDGLLPVFPGAFTLARMSKRPIRMMGLHGLHNLWHGDDKIGMTVTGRQVKVRAYPMGRRFGSGDEFVESFKSVVGHFGASGEDLPEWRNWMDGSAWEKLTSAKEEVEEQAKK